MNTSGPTPPSDDVNGRASAGHFHVPYWFTKLLSGIDGKTPDIGRVGPFVAMVAGIVIQAWEVGVNKSHFGPIEFFGGIATLWAGAGLGLKLKADTEPS
jgi:hypothetical protein